MTLRRLRGMKREAWEPYRSKMWTMLEQNWQGNLALNSVHARCESKHHWRNTF